MFNLSLAGTVAAITQYGYVVIFPIAVVEGPIISILSGFLASLGLFNIFIVYSVLVLGDLCGDTIYYCIGRFGAGPFFRRWGHLFKISEDQLLSLENNFKKHEVTALILGKTHPTGSLVLATAGFVKMKFNRFFFVSLFSTMVKTAILVAIGYYFGRSYVAIDNYLTKGGIIFLLLTVIGIVAYAEYHRRKKV